MRWDEMSMSQKSEAIGLMVRNGVTDIGTMKQMWDNMDKGKKKPSYADWVKGVNRQFMGPDYNLRAAYEELPFETMEAWRKNPNANHLPDTYKLPNHPTFSDESKYSQGPVIGGSWHYKPISQGRYLPEEILVGGMNGVDPNPMYRSFDDGGSSHIPPERFFGIAAPEVTENTLYQPSYGTLLPEVNVKAKGDPKKINNDFYKAHAVERADFEDRVAKREEQGWVPQTMLGLASLPLDVEGVVGLQLLYEQLPKWVLNVPKNSNRYYRIVDKRAIDDYISSEKIRSAQAAKEAGVDTEGPKQAGRFLLKKNHEYNMFSKGEPWQGGLATRDKNKPYILVSKENTGKTVWEQSNVDFRHKGHSGIYRPRYEGDLNATPSIYFDYYKPRLIGYTKHSFDEGGNIDSPPYWGQPTSQPQGPIEYLNRYVRSKAFESRSPDADYLNAARQNVDSFDMVYNDPAPKRIKYSPFYSDHMIQMYPGRRETPFAPYKGTMQVPYMAILAHEYGHNIDPYFESTRDIPENWMDMYERQSSEANEHDSRQQEMYADLQSLRYQLYEKHIYDIIKDGAFNEKHLEKALKQNIPNRLLQTMPKETIIEMMNTIAENSHHTGNQQETYIIPTDIGLGFA